MGLKPAKRVADRYFPQLPYEPEAEQLELDIAIPASFVFAIEAVKEQARIHFARYSVRVLKTQFTYPHFEDCVELYRDALRLAIPRSCRRMVLTLILTTRLIGYSFIAFLQHNQNKELHASDKFPTIVNHIQKRDCSLDVDFLLKSSKRVITDAVIPLRGGLEYVNGTYKLKEVEAKASPLMKLSQLGVSEGDRAENEGSWDFLNYNSKFTLSHNKYFIKIGRQQYRIQFYLKKTKVVDDTLMVLQD